MSLTKALVFLSIALIALLNSTRAEDLQQSNEISEKHMVDCLQEADFQCVKLRALANVFSLLQSKSLPLANGIKVEYSGKSNTRTETARALVDRDWGSLLFNFFPRMVNDLALKINIFPGGEFVLSRSQKSNALVDMSIETVNAVAEGRNKEKKKLAGSLLVFGGFYAVLITLGLVAVKFLAFKGILVGKVALVLAAIDGLSKLFSPKNHNQGLGYYHVDSYGSSIDPIITKGGAWAASSPLH